MKRRLPVKTLTGLSFRTASHVLWIHSIDRLARSLQDLQNIISQLIAKGVTVKFVKENLTFTRDN